MFEGNRAVATSTIAEDSMSKEERYELIAFFAQRFAESKETIEIEDRQVWDSNDINIDIDDFVHLCFS